MIGTANSIGFTIVLPQNESQPTQQPVIMREHMSQEQLQLAMATIEGNRQNSPGYLPIPRCRCLDNEFLGTSF